MDSGDLYDAYKNTEYRIFNPPISIRVGNFHPEMDRILESKDVLCWAFLTAWNPKSRPLSLEENMHRNELLKQDLQSFELWEGEGRGEAWSEESFLVLGIGLEQALSFARKFEQNAIVFGRIGEIAELVFR